MCERPPTYAHDITTPSLVGVLTQSILSRFSQRKGRAPVHEPARCYTFGANLECSLTFGMCFNLFDIS